MVKKIVISMKNKILSLVKKRAFYIVLVIIFSILLLVDIGIGMFVPVQTQMPDNMGDRRNMDLSEENDAFEGAQMPEMEDASEKGGMTGRPDMNIAEADGGTAAEDSGGAGIIDGAAGDRGNGRSQADFGATGRSGQMPEMFGETKNEGSSAMRFLYAVKSRWLVIFMILALLDIVSIVMLALLTKKKQARQLLELKEKMETEGEVHLIRKPEKKSHTYMTWVVPVVVLLLVVAVMKILTSHPAQTVSQTEASIHSAEAEKGSISTVLPGTGTLVEDTATTLDLPEGVELAEWYVSNGDFVNVGDKLAKVDKVSVMTVIASVQEKLNALDEEMTEHEDDKISKTVTATASGRVKAIYAEEDVDIVDTMYEHGSLVRISLDGAMAVTIETNEELSTGDTVVVTLSSGTEEIGKVESIINGTAVITLTDDGPEYGDTVSVSSEDGKVLGSGELYIHSELKVTGFIGTVTDVAVSVEDKVDAGETLLTLDDTGYIGEYERLNAQRTELVEVMQDLLQMYEEGYVYAEDTGVVSGLSETAAAAATGTSSAKNTAATADVSAELSFLTYSGTAAWGSSNAELSASTKSCTVATLSSATNTEEPTTNETEEGTGEEGEEEEPPDATENTEENPPETNESCYIAVVNAVSYQKIDILLYPVAYNMEEGINKDKIVSLKDKMTLPAELNLSDVNSLYLYRNGELADGNVADIQKGSFLVLIFDMEPELGTDAPVVTPVSIIYFMDASEENAPENGQNQQEGSTDNSGFSSNRGTSSEASTAAEYETAEQYAVTEVTWLSITPQDSMKITISVDEMDILALEVGQKAAVTLDAFPGQSFEGVVTSIDRNGTNSGGSSKYSACITIDRNENMLAGMNASVKITLETTENVLIIPVAALVEDETGVYVYTEYDEKSETFDGLTEVVTGVSDGEFVEIISGLTEGSKYWYSLLDVVNYSSSYVSSENSGGFSLNSLFGGGGRR